MNQNYRRPSITFLYAVCAVNAALGKQPWAIRDSMATRYATNRSPISQKKRRILDRRKRAAHCR